MLQQTTVAAVIPFYHRFLKSFPTVHALAKSRPERVLKHWEGLGYYRRARHLHAAAKVIVAEHGGVFPRDAATAYALPGVGRYILGAVLSQAYEQRLPIVEANSLRVLARLFGHREDPRAGEWVWQAAESLLPQRRVGDFNQAIMELGAIVCTPKLPKCEACPLRRECVARRDGLTDVIPPPKRALDVIAVQEVAVVVRRGESVLVGQRPADAARWASMWEFPHGDADDPCVLVKTLTGLAIQLGEELQTITHTITRYAITLRVLSATSTRGVPHSEFYSKLRWSTPAELRRLPMSTSQRAIAIALRDC